ncbi:MAG: hypothetical protein KJ818_07100, partial [Candidatus Omnitrophica bacterium]|nr:hypothetical protein [Candidatus Omnitrophota bacterium]
LMESDTPYTMFFEPASGSIIIPSIKSMLLDSAMRKGQGLAADAGDLAGGLDYFAHNAQAKIICVDSTYYIFDTADLLKLPMLRLENDYTLEFGPRNRIELKKGYTVTFQEPFARKVMVDGKAMYIPAIVEFPETGLDSTDSNFVRTEAGIARKDAPAAFIVTEQLTWEQNKPYWEKWLNDWQSKRELGEFVGVRKHPFNIPPVTIEKKELHRGRGLGIDEYYEYTVQIGWPATADKDIYEAGLTPRSFSVSPLTLFKTYYKCKPSVTFDAEGYLAGIEEIGVDLNRTFAAEYTPASLKELIEKYMLVKHAVTTVPEFPERNNPLNVDKGIWPDAAQPLPVISWKEPSAQEREAFMNGWGLAGKDVVTEGDLADIKPLKDAVAPNGIILVGGLVLERADTGYQVKTVDGKVLANFDNDIGKALVLRKGNSAELFRPGKKYIDFMRQANKGIGAVGGKALDKAEFEGALRAGFIRAKEEGRKDDKPLYSYHLTDEQGNSKGIFLGREGARQMQELGKSLYTLPIGGNRGNFRMVDERQLAEARAKEEVVLLEHNGKNVFAVKFQEGMPAATRVEIDGAPYALVGVPLYSMMLEYQLRNNHTAYVDGVNYLDANRNVYFQLKGKTYMLSGGVFSQIDKMPAGLKKIALVVNVPSNGMNTYYDQEEAFKLYSQAGLNNQHAGTEHREVKGKGYPYVDRAGNKTYKDKPDMISDDARPAYTLVVKGPKGEVVSTAQLSAFGKDEFVQRQNANYYVIDKEAGYGYFIAPSDMMAQRQALAGRIMSGAIQIARQDINGFDTLRVHLQGAEVERIDSADSSSIFDLENDGSFDEAGTVANVARVGEVTGPDGTEANVLQRTGKLPRMFAVDKKTGKETTRIDLDAVFEGNQGLASVIIRDQAGNEIGSQTYQYPQIGADLSKTTLLYSSSIKGVIENDNIIQDTTPNGELIRTYAVDKAGKESWRIDLDAVFDGQKGLASRIIRDAAGNELGSETYQYPGLGAQLSAAPLYRSYRHSTANWAGLDVDIVMDREYLTGSKFEENRTKGEVLRSYGIHPKTHKEIAQFFKAPKKVSGVKVAGAVVVDFKEKNKDGFSIKRKYYYVQNYDLFNGEGQPLTKANALRTAGYIVETNDKIQASGDPEEDSWKLVNEFTFDGRFVIARAMDKDIERATISSLPGDGYIVDIIVYNGGQENARITYRAEKNQNNEYVLIEKLSTFTVLSGGELERYLEEFNKLKTSLHDLKHYGFEREYDEVINELALELGKKELVAGRLEKVNDGAFVLYRAKADYLARVIAQKNPGATWHLNLKWDENGQAMESITVWDNNNQITSSSTSSSLSLRKIFEDARVLQEVSRQFVKVQEKENLGQSATLEDYLAKYDITEFPVVTNLIYGKTGKINIDAQTGDVQADVKYSIEIEKRVVVYLMQN